MSELAKTERASLGFADYAPELAKSRPRHPFHVRTATDLDLGGIIAVQAESARPPIESAVLEEILHDANRILLVALEGTTVVGWAKTHYWPHASGVARAGHYLGGVTVAPAHRRHAVADALTAGRLEWIRNRAADAWYVVNARNLASINLHNRWGFEEVTRSSSFHGTQFAGGVGILFHASIANDQIERGSAR